MSQKLTILFDLDGTLIDTAPDLMNAHNYVMKKFGYETKTVNDMRRLVGKGAASLDGRMIDAVSARMAENLVKKNEEVQTKISSQ